MTVDEIVNSWSQIARKDGLEIKFNRILNYICICEFILNCLIIVFRSVISCLKLPPIEKVDELRPVRCACVQEFIFILMFMVHSSAIFIVCRLTAMFCCQCRAPSATTS